MRFIAARRRRSFLEIYKFGFSPGKKLYLVNNFSCFKKIYDNSLDHERVKIVLLLKYNRDVATGGFVCAEVQISDKILRHHPPQLQMLRYVPEYSFSLYVEICLLFHFCYKFYS
jgi:hypothetical protein